MEAIGVRFATSVALRQMQALDALREQVSAQGTVRAAAPGATFTVHEHPVHDGHNPLRDHFVSLSVSHSARNNLRSDHSAQVDKLLGPIKPTTQATPIKELGGTAHTPHHVPGQSPKAALVNASDEPLYTCHILAQRAAVPVRLGGVDDAGLPDVRLHPRPTIHGVQTAIVVGSGAPLHTDRDQRIRVQFHWQRGANASHRLAHPSNDDNAADNASDNASDNAPATHASSSWVRVAQSVAGANWGAVFTPRLGQEVLVRFVGGNIDRPVVVGALYNGQGSEDAQGNAVGAGAASATGNASAWFPGQQQAGAKLADGVDGAELQGHQHAAVLAGYKSQELATSQSGSGGYNQLVFDDSPGGGRIELSSSAAQTRLQLGHLLHQAAQRLPFKNGGQKGSEETMNWRKR
jgi:type VI secretion system secreted protein VgrG